MSMVNTELGRSSTSLISLNLAESGSYVPINQNSYSKPNGLTPNSMSEWYGYNHSVGNAYTTPSSGSVNISTNTFLKSASTIPWVTGVTTNTNFSIVAWVKYNATVPTTPWYIFHARDFNSNQFTSGNNIWIRNGDFTTLQFGMSDNSTLVTISTPTPTINKWFHVAATFNGTSKVATLYLNGTSVASGTFSLSISTTTGRNLAIGGLAGNDNTNNTGNLSINNVGFYSKTLSGAEITTIYNTRNFYNLSNISSLRESWLFESSNGNSSYGTANLSNIGTPTYTTLTTYGAYP